MGPAKTTWLSAVLLSFLFCTILAHWTHGNCRGRYASALNAVSRSNLNRLKPECFSQLKKIESTDLSSVIPHLPNNIFAHYNGNISACTASVMRGRQLAHLGEEISGTICEQLLLHRFTPKTLSKISHRCLKGALSFYKATANVEQLPHVTDRAFAFVVSTPVLCTSISVQHLLNYTPDRLGQISPQCFANVLDISTTDFSTILPHLRKDIFAHFNSLLVKQVVSSLRPYHLSTLGSELRDKQLCQILDLRGVQPTTFAEISNRCFIGIMTRSRRYEHRYLMAFVPLPALRYLMTNPQGTCAMFPAKALLQLPDELGQELTPHCFALMRDISKMDFSTKINTWPDNIFERYDGALKKDQIQFISPAKIRHFAAELKKPYICSKLELASLSNAALLAITPRCLVGYVHSGNRLGGRWKSILNNGLVSDALFLGLCKDLQDLDINMFPQPYWDLAFENFGPDLLPLLYKEHHPKKFVANIRSNMTAFVWLAHALLTRKGEKEMAILHKVQRLVALFPKESITDINLKLFVEPSRWIKSMVAATFVQSFEEAINVLVKLYSPGNKTFVIPLCMDDGIFAFGKAFQFVQKQDNGLLSSLAEIKSDGFIDAGAPMRQWVDQMLDYISTKRLLQLTSELEARFPFMADPGVGTFVATVYAKALQMNIRPPLRLDESFLNLYLGTEGEALDSYFDRVYGPDLDKFLARVRCDMSDRFFDDLLKRYQFVEPEEMEARTPLRATRSIYPDDLSGDDDSLQPTRVYDRESFYSDYMRRFRNRCKELFLDLVSNFFQTFTKVVDLTMYGLLNDKSLFSGFFGSLAFSTGAIAKITTFDSFLGSVMVGSVVDKKNIAFEDTFWHVIEALGERERARFIGVMTGSQNVRLDAYNFTISRYSECITVPSLVAYGDDLFITRSVHDEIFKRLLSIQLDYLKNDLEDPYSQSPLEPCFLGSYAAACGHNLQLMPQSSHSLLLSIFQLLNLPLASMEDFDILDMS